MTVRALVPPVIGFFLMSVKSSVGKTFKTRLTVQVRKMNTGITFGRKMRKLSVMFLNLQNRRLPQFRSQMMNRTCF